MRLALFSQLTDNTSVGHTLPYHSIYVNRFSSSERLTRDLQLNFFLSSCCVQKYSLSLHPLFTKTSFLKIFSFEIFIMKGSNLLKKITPLLNLNYLCSIIVLLFLKVYNKKKAIKIISWNTNSITKSTHLIFANASISKFIIIMGHIDYWYCDKVPWLDEIF